MQMPLVPSSQTIKINKDHKTIPMLLIMETIFLNPKPASTRILILKKDTILTKLPP